MGYSPWGRKESDMTERFHFTHYMGIFIYVNTHTHTQIYIYVLAALGLSYSEGIFSCSIRLLVTTCGI